jgi:hypothetical protein
MKARCCKPKEQDWKYYGAKGIKVCDEWNNDFKAFLKWSLNNGYTDTLTIDRINHKSDYSPDNCQWLTMSENVKKARRQNATDHNRHLLSAV